MGRGGGRGRVKETEGKVVEQCFLSEFIFANPRQKRVFLFLLSHTFLLELLGAGILLFVTIYPHSIPREIKCFAPSDVFISYPWMNSQTSPNVKL